MYDEAKQLFLEGKSLRSISLLTGIDRKKLSLLLKEEGLNIKPRGLTRGKSKYNHNVNAFKRIDTEEKAYWLGFLYADGSVYQPRGTLELGLSSKDEEHLHKFRDFISPKMEVKSRIVNGHPTCRLQVVSMEIVLDLIDKGCVPAKSLTLTFPTEEQVPRELIHHFMRGYFDGDGQTPHLAYDPRWPKAKPQANTSIIGTKEFLDEFVNQLPDFPKREKYRSEGNAFAYRFGGNGLYKKFADFLYKDATIYLERKLLP